jgi:methylglyoxal synthase
MSPLLRFARDFMPFLVEHEIITTEGCYRAFFRAGLFWDHPRFRSVGAGYEGALVRITSSVVAAEASSGTDVVIYLVDPRDPSSNYPETNALKRECVVHRKPFLATSRSARLWASLLWRKDFPSTLEDCAIDPSSIPDGELLLKPLGRQTIALIAHNKQKLEMLEFAARHFDFLLSFGRRVGTGTTGSLLNGERPDHMPKDLTQEEWAKIEKACNEIAAKISAAKATGRLRRENQFVEPKRSGPMGGDVEIAHMVLDGGCQSIVFFEDPSIARQHEQDIQLLERTGRTRGKEAICVHDPTTAAEFACLWSPDYDMHGSEPLLVATALERRFHVKAIVTAGRGNPWPQILEAASWYLLSQVIALVSDRKRQGEIVRLTVSWGVGLKELAEALDQRRKRLEDCDRDWAGKQRRESYSPHLQLADERSLRPGHLEVAPMQGIMAAADDAVEANAISRRIAHFFGGRSLQLAVAALLDVNKRREAPEDILEHWDRSDILVTTCAPVRKEYAGLVRAPGFDNHFRQVEQASCGDFGGIYLKRDAERFHPERFIRIGMDERQIRKVRERGGQTILIAGAQPEREEIAFTTLETGLMSMLITDLEFAKQLLRRPPLHSQDALLRR